MGGRPWCSAQRDKAGRGKTLPVLSAGSLERVEGDAHCPLSPAQQQAEAWQGRGSFHQLDKSRAALSCVVRCHFLTRGTGQQHSETPPAQLTMTGGRGEKFSFSKGGHKTSRSHKEDIKPATKPSCSCTEPSADHRDTGVQCTFVFTGRSKPDTESCLL